jgi:hypothetical protein
MGPSPLSPDSREVDHEDMTTDLWPLIELLGRHRRLPADLGPTTPCPHCRAWVPMASGYGYFPDRVFVCIWCGTEFALYHEAA